MHIVVKSDRVHYISRAMNVEYVWIHSYIQKKSIKN